jgi:hypothetical protein
MALLVVIDVHYILYNLAIVTKTWFELYPSLEVAGI